VNDNPALSYSLFRQLSHAITSRRFVTSAVLTAVYIILFILYEQSNFPVTIFTILPVLTIAWFYGLKVGTVAALASVLLNVSLLLIVGGEIPASFWRGGIPGHFVSLIAAILVGRLHDVQKRLHQELQERHLVEEALRKSEAVAKRLALVAQYTHNGVLITDKENRIEWLNEGFTRITGYTLSDARGKKPSELLRPNIRAYIQGGRTPARGVAVESINHRKSGEPYWCQVEIQPLFGEDSTLIGYMSVETDITARKESEERYRELFEDAPAMYLLTRDENNRPIIAHCNDFFLKTLDYEAAEVVGRSLLDFYTPDSQTKLLTYGYQLALEGMFLSEERELVAKDGRIIPTLMRAVAEKDLIGQITGFRAMFVDITDLKQAEKALAEERAQLATTVEERTAELRAANAELTRAVRAKDQFLATMSHELRTPLNAILSKTEVLQEGILGAVNEKQQRSLQVIEESGRHLLSLISDILDIAKIGAGRLELEIYTVDVAEICEASLRLVKAMAHEKHIALELTIVGKEPALRADGRRLKQILVNLLSNGIKFTPENGQVGLEVTSTPGHIHFTAWDTGIGISPEGIAYLQQEADKSTPFVQLDSSFSRPYEGTGLGLSLVYRLTELHGGRVFITSQVGLGSRFMVSLPSHHSDKGRLAANFGTETTGKEEVVSSVLSPPHTGRILLVEDNPAGLEALSEFLHFKGYVVDVATNGLEAIEYVKKLSPDLVLMDVQMPVMDGLEATRRIRADKTVANIPIIMLTALVMPEDKERCLDAGANSYIGKPVRMTDLVDMIETQLQLVSGENK
jgi:PAS domain S-box-containing protein